MEKFARAAVGFFVFLGIMGGIVFVIKSAGGKVSASFEPKITIATDPPTGCEYLIYGTTMTPRLLPNGDQVCTQPTEIK